MRQSFDYDLVMLADQATVTSIIAYQESPSAGLQAVLWSVPRQQWIYAPAIAAGLLYDEEEDSVPTRTVDRVTAERVALETLRSPLPSEEALTALSNEGEQLGRRHGPPRSPGA